MFLDMKIWGAQDSSASPETYFHSEGMSVVSGPALYTKNTYTVNPE